MPFARHETVTRPEFDERPSSALSMYETERERQEEGEEEERRRRFAMDADRWDLSAPTRADNPIARLFSDAAAPFFQTWEEKSEDCLQQLRLQQPQQQQQRGGQGGGEQQNSSFLRLRSSSCPASRSVSAASSPAPTSSSSSASSSVISGFA